MGKVERSSDELAGQLADIELPDPDSQPHRLGELWAERAVVLIHLRHFGCILCRHYAGALRDSHEAFEARGARLVAIGTGGRKYARDFIEDRGIPYLVLVDKHLRSHEVIGAIHGPPVGIFRPRVVWAGIKALFGGEMQGKTGPHPFVFGAAHVFGPGGELRYAWLNEDYQDNAPVEDLLAAVETPVHAQAG